MEVVVRASRRAVVLMAVVLAITALAATVAGAGDPESRRSRYPAQKMIDVDFSVKPGGLLRVDVDDADIYIREAGGGKAHVEAFAAGPDEERAREYFEEELKFDARQEGNTIIVECVKPGYRSSGFWNRFRNIRVWAVISVPKKFDADVSTEDGDLSIAVLDGKIRARTEDGDFEVRELRGPSVDIRTEDGEIKAGTFDAKEIIVSTEDGDIEAENIKGGRVKLSSEDGDIMVKRIDADEISVEAEDGDIEIGASGGELTGRCEDGDIRMELFSEMEVDLITHDGDVHISIPESAGVELDLEGGRVSISGGIKIEGRVSDKRVVGSINDGGPRLRVKTQDGRIAVKRRG